MRKTLPVALALGTGWAARGQIGHEYGAAWAGAICVLAVICLSGRNVVAGPNDYPNEKPYGPTLLIAWAFVVFSILLLSYIAISCSPAKAAVQLRF